MRKVRFIEEASYNNSKQCILGYKQSLTEAFEHNFEELLSDLDRKWLEVSKHLEFEEQKAKDTQCRLIQESDELKAQYQSSDAMKILLSKFSPESFDINIAPVKTLSKRVPKFVAGCL